MRNPRARRAMAIALALILAASLPAMASDGRKYFKQGVRYEENKQWDKAAEQYAMASAERPSNSEYSLHLQRALVNAAIQLVEGGDRLADQKDYKAAYQSYRQAYSFDATNESALIKARKMLEAQGLPTENLPARNPRSGSALSPAPGEHNGSRSSDPVSAQNKPARATTFVPARWAGHRFPRQDIIFRPPIPVAAAIEQLAQTMHLNVVFDTAAFQQLRPNTNFSLELHDETAASALEIILRTNNLMYSQAGRRTIVIASDNPVSRQRYESQFVRTFYIKNADINEIKNALGTIGAKQVVTIKQLNAIVVRDAVPNLDLAEAMINSLDKSKAEILIDVKLYEVSHNNMLQIGNQFNSTASTASPFLTGADKLGGFRQLANIARGAGAATLTGPFGLALGLPSSTLSLLQDTGNSKLLASTQLHVLDGEQHQVRIGQRVPVQTGTTPSYSPTVINTPAGSNNNNNNNNNNSNTPSGYPQIQYENVGLNIDLTPNVFNGEVQMKMKIESSSIDGATSTLTPTFNQRQMQSVARIKDGQTTLVAGISQSQESRNVRGLPLIGLIPILGRFFATPNTSSSQGDIVMTVTPHILRQADIEEDDRLARHVGPESSPRRELTIQEILYLAEQPDDTVAAAPAQETAPAVASSSDRRSPLGFISQFMQLSKDTRWISGATTNPSQEHLQIGEAETGVVVMPVVAMPAVKSNH
jgi:general secretion pathway protein D